MQFLNEGSFLSWYLSYSLTKAMTVFSDDSINKAKNVDDSKKKIACTFPFPLI